MRRGSVIGLLCVALALVGCGGGSDTSSNTGQLDHADAHPTPAQKEMRKQRIHAEGSNSQQRVVVALIDAGQGRMAKAKLDLVEACPNIMGSELEPLVQALRRLSLSNPSTKTLEAELAAACPP